MVYFDAAGVCGCLICWIVRRMYSPIVLGTHGIAYHPSHFYFKSPHPKHMCSMVPSLDITEGKKALVLNAGFSQEAAWEPASGI